MGNLAVIEAECDERTDKAMSDVIRYWDLRNLRVSKTPVEPAYCWLLLKTCEAIPPSLWQAYFCVAVARSTSADPHIHAGQALSLDEAVRYIEKLLVGKVATHIPPLLTSYYADLRKADEPFALEARYFGEQFTTPYPNQGMRAFLEKEPAPWHLPPKTERELQNLLAWLRL